MITKISLENFKCFLEYHSVNLSQINILTGINGRGKSSLLQSLLLLSQSLKVDNSLNYLTLNGDFVSLGTFKDILNRDAESDNFSISFQTDDNSENNIKCNFSNFPSKERLAQLSGLWVDEQDYFDIPASADITEKGNSDKKVSGATSSIAGFQQLKNVYYISANRQGPTNYVEKNDNITNKEIGIKGEHAINVLSSNGAEFIESVRKALSFILSGASIRIPESKGNIIEMFIDSKDKSEGFLPVNVGFGYSYILPIILTSLLAEEKSIIVIENPEAHLHPGAQSRLISFLIEQAQKKNLQFFLETHSDHIINGVRVSIKKKEIGTGKVRILHFSCDDSKSNIIDIDIDERGELSKYPDDFMDEWTKQLSELV
jgi:predicted ATPase